VTKSHQLLCMPMLGVTLAWKQRLADEAPAAPLLPLLDQCAARLLQHYSAVLRDRVDAIARCATNLGSSLRSACRQHTADADSCQCHVRFTTSSLNTLHVLPFLANFVSMAERLETVLAELSEQPLDGFNRRCRLAAAPQLLCNWIQLTLSENRCAAAYRMLSCPCTWWRVKTLRTQHLTCLQVMCRTPFLPQNR